MKNIGAKKRGRPAKIAKVLAVDSSGTRKQTVQVSFWMKDVGNGCRVVHYKEVFVASIGSDGPFTPAFNYNIIISGILGLIQFSISELPT